MVRESPPEPTAYPDDKARGGHIELQHPWQRYVFVAGLFGIVVLLLLLRMFA